MSEYLYFESWGLLVRAVIEFNEYQEKFGGDTIEIKNYLKFGKKMFGWWVLHDIKNPPLQEKWEKFISDKSNRVIFTDAQLRGEEI